MLSNEPLNMKLVANGIEYPIHTVMWDQERGGDMVYTAKGFLPKVSFEGLYTETEHARQERLRKELIDFAKTGGPRMLEPGQRLNLSVPAPDFEHGKKYVYDATSQTFDALLVAEGNVSDHAWVDGSPTYSAVLAARSVPRSFEQKPWIDPVKESVDIAELRREAVRRVRDAGIFELPKRKRPENLNVFAAECHALNQTWWRDPKTGAQIDRNMGELLMLTVSEIAECMEGERKSLPDDHLPHRPMAEVELADAVLRLADIAGSRRLDIEGRTRRIKHDRYLSETMSKVQDNKGAALLRLCSSILGCDTRGDVLAASRFAAAIWRIERYAEKYGYDLWGAVAEKREYNRHRADHKPAARLAANGKKF